MHYDRILTVAERAATGPRTIAPENDHTYSVLSKGHVLANGLALDQAEFMTAVTPELVADLIHERHLLLREIQACKRDLRELGKSVGHA